MFKRKKKKTGCETPEFRSKVPMPPVKPAKPNQNFGWQPQYTSTQNPPPPPTSGSNAVKPNPNYVPPASVAKTKVKEIDTHTVQLYCTVDDLNAYIHQHLGETNADNIYVPIGADIDRHNLNVSIDFVAINPKDCDYGRRVRLEVKL